MKLSNEYIQSKKNLEKEYFDNFLSLDTLKEYITNMIPEIKGKNDLLRLEELIRLFIFDNNYFSTLSYNLVLKLVDDGLILLSISTRVSLKESHIKKKSHITIGPQPYTSISDDLCWCAHEKTYHINKDSCSECDCKEFDP